MMNIMDIELIKNTKNTKKKYPGLTKFVDSVQISGSKVFEWKWIIIKK